MLSVYIYFVKGEVRYLKANSKAQAKLVVEKNGFPNTEVYEDNHRFVVVDFIKTKYDMEYYHSIAAFAYPKSRRDIRYAKYFKVCSAVGLAPIYDTVSFLTPKDGLTFYKLVKPMTRAIEDLMFSNNIGTLEKFYKELVSLDKTLRHVVHDNESAAWDW